jgi:hypothetical protein
MSKKMLGDIMREAQKLQAEMQRLQEEAKKKTPRKKDLKEKLLSEPLVKEAIELFDGRIVDIKSKEQGGRDV